MKKIIEKEWKKEKVEWKNGEMMNRNEKIRIGWKKDQILIPRDKMRKTCSHSTVGLSFTWSRVATLFFPFYPSPQRQIPNDRKSDGNKDERAR